MSYNSYFGGQNKYRFIFVFCLAILVVALGLMQVSPATTQSIPAASDDIEEPNYVTYLPALFWPRNENVLGMQMSYIGASGGLNKIAETNTFWVGGVPVLWSEVEGTRGVYNWTTTDQRANQWKYASIEGLKIIGNVRSTPSWARLYSKYYCGPMQSQYFDEFADFMYQVVKRYSGAPYNVMYWEIWNEPDVAPSQVGTNYDSQFGCWGNTNDSYYGGGYYADMLKVVYPAIKSANPKVQVLVGGLLMNCDPNKSTSCKETKFFEGILRNNGGPYFDGVSFHAYDYYSYTWGTTYDYNVGKYQNNTNWSSQWNTTGPVLIEKTNYLRSVLSNYGVTGKYLLNTEVALNCRICTGVNVSPYNENPTPAFETTKAYYITQAYAAAINIGLKANLWYSLLGWPEQNTELLNADLTEREGFVAYRVACQKLAGASSLGEITGSDVSSTTGIKGYKFNYRNRKIWVVWSLDGNNHPVTLTSSGTLVAVTDALGNPQPVSTALTITIKPLYIEWIP
ncbi:MAG: hypothetical protein JW908_10415 [Anaerolineales bacterium]|nr:hypothetical protein [Anaerolineales bacterium]